MGLKLRDLIRNVRSCKTSAEERSVIAKECAAIRTSFKENDPGVRHQNVAKLLFIHMLGYPTHFGQVECLKLIASHRFPEKRIGYLGLMTMLDERQQVLMLVTNSLKQDLNDKNPYVVGLALCSMGNISSPDILRDLQGEVERVMRDSNPYVRKKAVLVMLRTIRKVPELLSDYTSLVRHALTDKSPSVVLAGVAFAIEMLRVKPRLKTKLSKLVPAFVKSLKALTSSGYSGERDICGISDPFLQVRFMRLLRVLGIQNPETSEQMNDVLAQVATNTETGKNPGSSVLYECVRTIMSIEAESGLRVMAINILGRFLLNRDNNIRYVALKTLCECVKSNSHAIQRHRNTIVESLKDADISIRRRALDLTYALVNKSTVRPLVGELVNYLELSHGDRSFKADLAAKVTAVIERFSPDPKWHIDMLTRVLEAAGSVVAERIPYRLAILISEHGHLRPYSVHRLFACLMKDDSHSCVVNVALWAIGEYSTLLTSSAGVSAANAQAEKAFTGQSVSSVIDAIESCVLSINTRLVTQQYALTALLKLANRHPEVESRISSLISQYRCSSDVEIQSRSCEYTNLLDATHESLRAAALEPMPAIDPARVARKQETEFFEEEQEDSDEDGDGDDLGLPVEEDHVIRESPSRDTGNRRSNDEDRSSQKEKKKNRRESKKDKEGKSDSVVHRGDDILDVLGLFGGDASTGTASAPAQSSNTDIDVLADIFGSSLGGLGDQAMAPTESQGDLLDLHSLDGTLPSAASHGNSLFGAAPRAPKFPPLEALNSNGIIVNFSFERANDQIAIRVSSVNTNSEPVLDYEFKAAVPKYINMHLKPASGNELPPNGMGDVTQLIIITNSLAGQKPLLMKVKVNGSRNGVAFTEQAQVSGFPPGF